MNCDHKYEGRRCAKCGKIYQPPDVEASHRAIDRVYTRLYLRNGMTADELERWENPKAERPMVDKDGNRI